MELGLSLGDAASKPFGFMEKPLLRRRRHHHEGSSSSSSSKGGLGFCMGLSIGQSVSRDEEIGNEREEEDDGDGDGDEKKLTTTVTALATTKTTEAEAKKTSGGGVDCEIRSSVDPPIQLDLLPNTPVPRNPSSSSSFLPFPWMSDNGSSDAGSSGQMAAAAARGFDVNKFPLAEEPEDGAATLSSSPNNSAASSFQMDFCMYSGGNKNKEFESGGLGNEIETERASSRVSDEDENGCTRKKLRLSKDQSAFLEESFKEHNTLNPKQKLALAKQLNLRPRQVEVWFQNRRARTKLKQTEVDCEYLKRCCETLTEENRRLHKELQELRALKTSNPFYMQLPATTLTMCPSCERVATTNTNPTSTTSAAAGATTTTPTTAATATTATTTNTSDPTSKATTGFSLTKPRFFPFSQNQNHHQLPKHLEKSN